MPSAPVPPKMAEIAERRQRIANPNTLGAHRDSPFLTEMESVNRADMFNSTMDHFLWWEVL